jgi:type I restriction enzyme R subunit
MCSNLTESTVEQAALEWLEGMGYKTLYGPSIAPDMPDAERASYSQVVLKERFREALWRLNPELSEGALEEAFRKLTRPNLSSLIANNHTMHSYLVEGVPVECRRSDGSVGGDLVKILDYVDIENNEFLVVNQFTVVENQIERRPDIVMFVNGLPLVVMELKSAVKEEATITTAYNQIQVYKQQIPSLFNYNEALVVSDGIGARIGTLTASKEWFLPWRTIEGEKLADKSLSQLQVLLEGVFDKRRFLDLVRHFIVFDDDGGGVINKKMAGYHQYHAVNTAVQETLKTSSAKGNRQIGVVWHTQGSGKSLTMAFYAGRLVIEPEMKNPTVVVITDRNDLDDQLFSTFARCHELLRQPPVQAESRENLREILKTGSGGVIFATVQKFFPIDIEADHPLLSDRNNIVVIADEAHRSQYDFIDGYARYMRQALPNASFIGFTGTPIEFADKNTRAVFGDYISIYDIHRAVEDKATVPIYYESRLAKLELDEAERPHLDDNFEEVTEGEEVSQKERLKTKWAQLEALVGSEKRISLVARDIIEHYEKRLDVIEGKAMIVCMSRRICVELYHAICRIKPEWCHEDDSRGIVKVVMTGGVADPPEWQQHIRNKFRREELAKRFKNPHDQFKVVIVRDMWLTGFDAPSLHTMYVDKPMRGHGLMQAIARVNRVYKDKSGGLVVDYLGLAHELKAALSNYTESGGEGETAVDQEVAVQIMLEKYEVCRGIMHGFDWSRWKVRRAKDQLSVLPAAQNHVLGVIDGKKRFNEAVAELSKAFALAIPDERAIKIRDDVGFFQALKTVLNKNASGNGFSKDDVDHAIRQIISRAVVSDEVIDIFAAAGLERPEVSVLSEKFLEEVRGMKHKNLAVDILKKLLNGEIISRGRKNVVQSRSFMEMLENSIRKYQNRAIEAIEVIEELLELAREMREAGKRGEKLGLNEDEVAFYDALGANDSAVQVLGDEILRTIAQELLKTVRANVTIDWAVRENVRAKMRVMIKRILRKYGYPPDKQARATELVLEQAELICSS